MKGKMLGTLISLILGLAALNGWMYLQQPSMIFFPAREIESVPSNWGLEYEDVSFQTRDGVTLHGWYVPKRGSDRVLLFFHGNAGNISNRRDSVQIFHGLGLNVFIFDYRGYGRSSGTPTENGVYLDGAAAWDYLTKTRGVGKEDIVIFGRSLGGAVAAKLASDVQPRALILESTFSSARDFAQSVFPVLSRLIVLRYDFNTAERLKRVRCAVLVLHSPQDEIMPFALGEKVYRAANEPKTFVTLRGDHNSGFLQSQPDYERALGRFLSRQFAETAADRPAGPPN